MDSNRPHISANLIADSHLRETNFLPWFGAAGGVGCWFFGLAIGIFAIFQHRRELPAAEEDDEEGKDKKHADSNE